MSSSAKGEADGLRHVLVTGGTSGIGEAIAAGFERDGCAVTVCGLTPEEVVDCQTRHVNWRVIECDVADAIAVERLREDSPRLDVLVNAAGMLLRQGREFQLENFSRVVEVNLTSVMRVSTALLEPLAARRGCIINVASMLSFFGSGFVPAYSASKGGVAQLTKSLAIAWASRGVRVNAIAPGWIRTPLTQPLYSDESRSRSIVERTPLGRWGEPSEVAGVARFLASADASFVTGAVIPVDGGYLIT